MAMQRHAQTVTDTDDVNARTFGSSDGRQATLQITSSGRAMHERIAEYLRHRQEQVLAGLNPEERKTLSTILKKAALHAALLDE